MISFTVPGLAAPQGSKSVFRTKSGRIALVESSAKVKPYRAVFAMAARQAWNEPLSTEAVAVELLFSSQTTHAVLGRGVGRIQWKSLRQQVSRPLQWEFKQWGCALCDTPQPLLYIDHVALKARPRRTSCS